MAVAEVFGIGAIFWFKDLASSKMRKAGLEVDKLKTKLEGMEEYNLAMSKGLTTLASGIKPLLVGTALYASPMLFAASVGKLNETLYMTAKTANATNEQLEQMKNLTFEISKNSIFSTNDIAEGMYEITSAGMDASQAMGLMKGSVSKFAIASGMSIKDSSDMITSAMLAFNTPVDKAMRIADKFIQIQNITKVHFGELKSIVARVAGPAAVMGQSLEQALSWVGMLQQTGVTASVAGTRYARLVQRLSSRKFREFAIMLHAPRIGLDKEGKDLPISKTLEQLDAAMTKFGYNKEGKRMATNYLFGRLNYDILERMKKFKFHRVVNGKTIDVMGAEAVRAAAKNLNKESVGKTEKRAEEMMKLFINQWKQFKNILVATVKEIGEIATPQATEMLKGWVQNAKAMASWIKEHKTAVGVVLKLATTVGKFLILLGSLRITLGLIRMAKAVPIGFNAEFRSLKAGYLMWRRSARLAGSASTKFLSMTIPKGSFLKAPLPGILRVGLYAALAGEVTKLYLTWREYRRELNKTTDAIENLDDANRRAAAHLSKKYGVHFKSAEGSMAFTAALGRVRELTKGRPTTQKEEIDLFLKAFKSNLEGLARGKYGGTDAADAARRALMIDQAMKSIASQPEMIAKALKSTPIHLTVELDGKVLHDAIVEQEEDAKKRAGKKVETAQESEAQRRARLISDLGHLGRNY